MGNEARAAGNRLGLAIAHARGPVIVVGIGLAFVAGLAGGVLVTARSNDPAVQGALVGAVAGIAGGFVGAAVGAWASRDVASRTLADAREARQEARDDATAGMFLQERRAAIVAALITGAAIVAITALGTAVAATIGGLLALAGRPLIAVIGAGTSGAVVWTAVTWRLAIPSSSSHALVGGLLGAGLLQAGPSAITWGRLGPGGSTGVLWILVGLAISPLAAAGLAYLVERLGLRLFARTTVRAAGPVRAAQYLTSAWLAATRKHLADMHDKQMADICRGDPGRFRTQCDLSGLPGGGCR